MDSFFYHLQLNIDFSNKYFYRNLFEFLGWSTIFETLDTVGYKSKVNGDIWLVDTSDKSAQDYDAVGLNHIAIRVGRQRDIDTFLTFLGDNSIDTLFETPKHRKEFVDSDNETYYQVMFKSPDNILFEVVYIGAREVA